MPVHAQSTKESGISPKARRKARIFALQALYQWSYTHTNLNELETQYMISNNHHRVDWGYFSELVHGVPGCLAELDEVLQKASELPLKDMSPIELHILRLAVFEFTHCKIPGPVVINEYVDIAHEYGTEEGYRFVNGVLDKAIKRI